MHPGTRAGERPQERGREHERVHPRVGEQLPRIDSPQQGQHHGWVHQRRVEQETGREHPRPPVAAHRQQQHARARYIPDQHGVEIDGQIAVLPVVVVPYPREQHQRRRHLDRGNGDEHVRGAADEDAGGQFRSGRCRRSWRRIRRGVEGFPDPRDHAQAVEQPAAGRRRQPRAPVPLHVLVQCQRLRHVDDDIVTTVVTHRTVSRHCTHHRGRVMHAAPPRDHESALLLSIDVREAGPERPQRAKPADSVSRAGATGYTHPHAMQRWRASGTDRLRTATRPSRPGCAGNKTVRIAASIPGPRHSAGAARAAAPCAPHPDSTGARPGRAAGSCTRARCGRRSAAVLGPGRRSRPSR